MAGVLVGSGFRAAPTMAALVLALNLVARVGAIVTPLMIKSFINAIASHHGRTLAVQATLIAATTVGGTAAITIGAITGYGGLTSRVDLYLTARVATLINAAPGLAHLERPDHAREIELLSEQRPLLASGPNLALVLCSDLARTAVMLWVLATVSPILTLVPVLSVAPFLGGVASTRYRARVDDDLALDIRLANRLFTMTTTAAAAKELRVFGADRPLAERHAALARRISRRTSRAGIVAGLLSAAGWTVFAGGFAGAILLITNRAVHGQATLGDVVLTVLMLQRAQNSAVQLAQATAQLQSASRVAKRFLWLEDQAATPVAGAVPPGRLRHGISLDKVSFAYPGTDAPALDDLTVYLPAGSATAIVGENGAGKTTLAKLLTRMCEPDHGDITVDGEPLADLDLRAWRSRTTATFQDFGRYELRAGHNVGLGDLPRLDDDAAVLDALDRAGAGHLIATLDDGLDTLLGRSFPGGRELSGGQWQNLALARGRMRADPLLLILDEPTASLDAPTEHALFQRYLAATAELRQRTGAITIIVSHRFSTVRQADHILVLDRGRVAEYGNHDELLNANGLYAELFLLQARGYR